MTTKSNIDFKKMLGKPNERGGYEYPDGSKIWKEPQSGKWCGKWSDGKPLTEPDEEGCHEVISRFETPEEIIKCFSECEEGPYRPVIQAELSSSTNQTLTKRELIAAMAMQGMLAADWDCQWKTENVAAHCVRCADALIKELDK